MSLSKLFQSTGKLFTSALKKAQTQRLDIHSTSLLSTSLLQLLTSHANAIGVPNEFILWPLLTTVASFIGTNGHVRINSEWVEPAIIWFVIAARKGEKKTAALRRIRKPVEEIEERVRKEWTEEHPNEDKTCCPQLIVDHFSFEELHSIMYRNSGQILGCFDEMSSFYGQLDLYKHLSTMDRKTLLTLNGGGAWTRNFKSYSSSIKQTAFNVTGFIQPKFVFEMLHAGNDADGLNDRQLFDFPPERELMLDELKVPIPTDAPDLKMIFPLLMTVHKAKQMYTLEGEAYDLYRETHDELVREKLESADENVQGILSKARGYVARIAMILHCLEQAIECVENAGDLLSPDRNWETVVSPNAVRAATAIVQHFNRQKFIALGCSESSPSTSNALSTCIIRLLSMESKQGDGVLKLSEIAQKHISQKVGMSYPTSKAAELIDEAANLGFGDVLSTETPNRRASIHFKKRPLSDLNETCREILKKSRVSSEKYHLAFETPSTLSNSEN